MPEGLDARMAMEQSAQNELVQRKIQMDALRARLGDGRDEKAKLRESCEGFESIFLQKMWEQMRKNVSKEGYLHSKDEEAYQSLFDVELCKKMASAGGIGLADMLYTQLSQKLDHAGRATTPGTYRAPVATPAAPVGKTEAVQTVETEKTPVEKLTAENLYAEAGPEVLAAKTAPDEPAKEPPGPIEAALNELRAVVEKEDAKTAKAPVDQIAGQPLGQNADQAGGQNTMSAATAPVGVPVDPEGPVPPTQMVAAEALLRPNPVAPASTTSPGSVTPAQSVSPVASPVVMEAAAARKAAQTARQSRKAANPRSASWIGSGPVSAEPKPLPRARRAGTNTPTAESAGGPPLPTDGQVVGTFGWTQEPGGQRRWNNGLDMAAAPGAPVRAVLSGAVAFVGEQRGMGSLVVLEHEGGLRSYYAGVDAAGLAQGQKIEAGANFAKVAVQPDPAAGTANSALLHFELKRGEMALNPESVLGDIPS